MKSILLLAMSTFSRDENENSFYIENEDKVITNCIGQLEPIPKYMMQTYPKNETEIIALCTKNTMQVVENGLFGGESPLSFFITQMNDYSETIGISHPHIRAIDLDENNPKEAIISAVNMIRSIIAIDENIDGNYELWIDTHGGFRDIALIMQAIISLLRFEKITPQKILGVRYGTADNKNYIVNQNQAFEIFSFVAGMYDFVNYGNAEVLRTFISKEESANNEVADAICQISDGIQVCDVNEYRTGLNALNTALNREISGKTWMALFNSIIKADFGNLLCGKNKRTIDIIKRCYEKKLYQQALTFLESSMPEEILKYGIIVFGKENLQNDIFRLEASSNDETVDEYLFNQYIARSIRYNDYDMDYKKAIKHFYNYKSEYLKFIKKGLIPDPNVDNNYAMDTFFNITNRSNKCPWEFECQTGVVKNISTECTDNKKNYIGLFFRMHKVLKTCRNKVNHVSGKRPPFVRILSVLELYISYAEYLIDDM